MEEKRTFLDIFNVRLVPPLPLAAVVAELVDTAGYGDPGAGAIVIAG